MPFEFDVVVVGAGPAGCAAAYDLAWAGVRVVLLDKRSFPRHKACACGLTRKTLKVLRYSVDPVIERTCRDVVLQEAGPAFLHGRRVADKRCEVRVRMRNPFCAMAVRERFDDFCLRQTLAQGAELRKIDAVVALREFEDGVELDLSVDGEIQTLRAAVVIGADGSNGQMRRLAAGIAAQRASQPVSSEGSAGYAMAGAANLPEEPAWYARGFALEATVPFTELPGTLPAGDRPEDLVFDFSPIAGGYGWLFPKGDHVNIGVGGFVPRETSATAEALDMQYESVTRALLTGYASTKLGVDLAALRAAHVTGQHLGLGGHAYVPEGRVLLAGDAAGLVDPLTGEGIHSAVVSGQAAAAAIIAAGASSSAEVGDGANRVSARYAQTLKPLQDTLAFSYRAARSFYREPERGFKVMRAPLLRRLVLKTYADGLPTTKLLTKLAQRVA